MVYNCKKGQDEFDLKLLKTSKGAVMLDNRFLKQEVEELKLKLQHKKSISEWMEEFYSVAAEHGWHGEGNEKTFSECLLLVHAEISEAVEEYRKGYKPEEVWYSQSGQHDDQRYDKPEGIAIELADVFIRLLDTCKQFGIDLETAVQIKNDFNKTRPFRHGNKKI